MIIERQLAPYVVFSEDPVLTALQKITANKARQIFCVNEHGHLDGSLSDGDFRRWIVDQPTPDLSTATVAVANTALTRVTDGTPVADIEALFRPGVTHIPVVDAQERLVAIAVQQPAELHLGRHRVGPDAPAVVIAEIGNNHNGSVDLAKQLIDLAVDAGADIVKFQLRDMAALYRHQGETLTSGEDLGAQYTLDLLSRFSLSAEQMYEVFDHARARDVDVMCTPWDIPSLDALAAYGVPALKIASADLTNHTLLRAAAGHGLPMVLSTGMSTEAEIRESVRLVQGAGVPFALLQCQSTYPAPYASLNLAYMGRLAEIGSCPVGYSGHERGWHVPIAAVARGAKIIEKHFTVDRSMEGNDHVVSLLPDEFATMVREIREVEESLGSTAPRVVSAGEVMNRANLAKSLVATRRIEVGMRIEADAVAVKSPGRGLQPNRLPELLGRQSVRVIEPGDFFYDGDVDDTAARPRPYTFHRPWGVPVRYHDLFPILQAGSDPDFVEFHYSYKDLDIEPSEVFSEKLPIGYTCHLPDLFAGDFILDLASFDDEVWERSIREMQRSIDRTRQLRPYFTQDEDPIFIATLGGFTKDGFVDRDRVPAMYERIADGLQRVDASGVRLCPQTLPPYPWLMGGQQYHNLFLHLDDTVAFAETYGYKLTFDISHSKLAANFTGVPFSRYVERLTPLSEHFHVVDATGVDGEGVQVGEGEVDFAALAQAMDRMAPGKSFIPEIWMGHVNNGQGFWHALNILEQWF